MIVSVFPCVNCGSTDLRRSRIHSKIEWLQTMVGTYPFRCLRCNYRFQINIWLWSRLAFAKCPKCLRPELNSWPAQNYRLPFWKNLLVTFGAHRYRCKACRCRFVSFRPLEKSLSAATDLHAEGNSVPQADLVPETETDP